MSYYIKYLKYKSKYKQLKKQMGGVDYCEQIFDLDCFLPPFRKINPDGYDFIDDKKISDETLKYIKLESYMNYYNINSYITNTDQRYNIDSILSILDDIYIPRNDYRTLGDLLLSLNIEISIPIFSNYKSVGIINENILIEYITNFINKNIPFYDELNKYIVEYNNEIYDINSYIDLISNKDLLEYHKSIFKSFNTKMLYIYKYYLKNLIHDIKWHKGKLNDSIKTASINTEQTERYERMIIHIGNLLKIINSIISHISNSSSQYKIIFNYINYDIQIINRDFNIIKECIKNRNDLIIDIIYKILQLINKPLVINLDLIFYKKEGDDFINDPPEQQNSIIIYKVIHEGKDIFIGIRNEPHRRSSEYCRNSIRKYIRNLFFNNYYFKDRFYYMDDFIGGSYGLQNERKEINILDNDIEKNKIIEVLDSVEFRNFINNEKLSEILKEQDNFIFDVLKIDGIIDLLRNKDIKLFDNEKVCDFLLSKGLNELLTSEAFRSIKKSETSKKGIYYLFDENTTDFKKDYDYYKYYLDDIKNESYEYKISKSPLNTLCGYCTAWVGYSNLIYLLNMDKKNDAVKRYLYNYFIESINYEEPNQEYLQYIIRKHVNLYKFMIFTLYYYKVAGFNIYDDIISEIDDDELQYLNHIFKLFDDYGVMDKLSARVKFLNNQPINLEIFSNNIQELKDKDKHLCADNIFKDYLFCNENIVYGVNKNLIKKDKINKYNCKADKIKLVGIINHNKPKYVEDKDFLN